MVKYWSNSCVFYERVDSRSGHKKGAGVVTKGIVNVSVNGDLVNKQKDEQQSG